MGLSEIIGGFYAKIEDLFYGAMDSLDEKGIPVYAVIDPLEEHGVPALPASIFAVLVLWFLVFGIALAPQVQSKVTLNFVDKSSLDALSGVNLNIKDSSGNTVDVEGDIFTNGQEVYLPGVRPGEELTFVVERDGYAPKTVTATIVGTETNLRVELERQVKIIEGEIELADIKTFDKITDAQIIATLADNTTTLCSFSLQKNNFICAGMIEGDEVRLEISSGNYEDKIYSTKFYENSVQAIDLEPKGFASTGEANLIVRVVDAQTQSLVSNATIQVFDSLDNGLITQITDDDGEILITDLDKGISARLVVSAQSYVRYDSGMFSENRTLRNDEEVWVVKLMPGGVSVNVSVNDLSGLPQSFATVQLFNSNNELVDSQETQLGGEVFFDNLSVEQTYFATAVKDGFLATRKQFNPVAGVSIDLQLEQLTSSNSSRMVVFVTEKGSLGANNAALNFFELIEGEELPLGLAPQRTDVTGKYTLFAKNNSMILVKATKDNLAGETQTTVTPNQNNDILVELFNVSGLITLKFITPSGQEIREGHVKIASGDGTTIEELDIESLEDEEEIVFDSIDNEFVKVTFTGKNGESFSEEVNVKDSTDVVLTVSGNSGGEGFVPKAEFKGITTLSGKKVEGLTKGDAFYLLFEVIFPQQIGMHGFHVRVGDDTVKHVDSDEVGLTGFLASNDSHFYGRTYSMLPEPGAEGVDFQNEGTAGEPNKFLELYFDEGGTKLIKVKVQAKETTQDAKFDLHFRAWSKFGEDYFRTPKDSILGEAFFSEQKSSLYSESFLEQLKIFGSQSTCEGEFCASYKFVSEEGEEFDQKDFFALQNKKYALLVEINPTTQIEATVKGSTSRGAPKIFWQGFSVDNASVFPDNNRLETSIEAANILSAAEKPLNVYLFFKVVETGNVQVTVQTITENDVVTDNLFFEAFEEKELKVSTSPQEILFGENFSFNVKDSLGSSVENAQIILSDEEGKHLLTIIGNGAVDKGQNGLYLIKNSFDTGKIRFEAKARGYKPAKGELQVFQKEVFVLPQEIVLSIPKTSMTLTRKVPLLNNSQELISDVKIDVKRKGNFPVGLNLRATTLGLVEPNASEDITITADYSGKNEREHGEAEMIVTGRLLNKFFVRAQSKLILDYNPELAQDCLEFSKGRLSVFVESGFDNRNSYNDYYERQFYNPQSQSYQYNQVPEDNDFFLTDEQGLSESRYLSPYNRFFGSTNTKQVDLTIRNKCDVEIELLPEIVAQSLGHNEGINVQVNSVKLKPAGTVQGGRRLDEQRVAISVTNSVLRNYPQVKTFSFDIFFNSDQVSASVPLDVVIWNPRFALEFNRNIELWLSQENPSTPARASAPVFLRNVGQSPIENLNFRTRSTTTGGTINIRVLPSFPIEFLSPGQSVIPPKTIVAEAFRTDKTTPYDVKQIEVYGLIDGKSINFGSVFVTSHISGFECLKVTPNSIEFFSEKTSGVISKKIKVKSTCAEEVRLAGISPKEFGGNQINATLDGATLFPGQEAEFELIFSKKESSELHVPIFVDAYLERSGQFIRSNPVNADVKIGENATKTKLAFEEKQVPVCESEGEVRLVKFPKIATSDNCETAYCDAEQLAAFLVKKGAEKLQQARREVSNYKSEVLNTSCSTEELSQGYCSFSNLNVRQESFTVYFSNDNLTPDLLKKTADMHAKDIAGFNFDYLVGTNVGQQIGSIGKKFLLDAQISGCGVYTVTIGGALKVLGTRIDPELVNIVVDLTPQTLEENAGEEGAVSELTEQCLPKIQNVANFLPANKSSESIEESQDSWAAVVEPQEDSLSQSSRSLSEKMFGSQRRGEKSPYNTNKLLLSFGGPNNYLAKVEMDRTTGSEPRKINAFIQDTQDLSEKTRAEILNESVNAIAALKNNVIDGCISPDEDYFLLKSVGTLRGLDLSAGACIDESTKIPGKLSVLVGKETCCSINVSGQITENVKLNPLLVNVAGVSQPIVKAGGTQISEFELIKNERPAQQGSIQAPFLGSALVCVTGLPDAQVSHNKKIELNAESTTNSERKTPKTEVVLQFCGLHPTNLADKLVKQKPGEYYFTPVWQGYDRPVTGDELRELLEAKAYLDDAKKSVESANLSGQTAFESKQKYTKLGGLGAYLAACGAVSAFANLKFGFGWLGGVFFDCVVPFMSAASDVVGAEKAKESVVDFFKGIPVVGGVINLFGAGGEQIAGLLGDQKNTVSDSDLSELSTGALTSVSAYSIAQGVSAGSGIITSSSASSIATQVSNQLADKFIETNFPDLPAADTDALRNAYAAKSKSEMEVILKRYLGKNWDGPITENQTILQKAITDSVEAVSKDDAVLKEFVNLGDKISITSKKEAFKQARNQNLKSFFDLEPAKNEAVLSNAVKDHQINQILNSDNFPVPEPESLNTARDTIRDGLFDRSWPQLEQELSNKLGENVIVDGTNVNVKTAVAKLKTQYKNALTKEVERLNPIYSAEKIYVLKVGDDEAKKIVDNAFNNFITVKKVNNLVSKGVEKQISEQFTKEWSNESLGLIESDGGKFKLNWTKFRSLLRSVATKAFWKDMLKGGAGGILSNAVGLFTYKQVMENFGTPPEADLQVGKIFGGEVDGLIEKGKDVQVKKYSVYKAVIEKEGKVKELVEVTDYSKIPTNAAWLNECSDKNLATYQGLTRLQPNPSTFKDAGLTENIPAIVLYYENVGRILNGLNEAEPLQGFPEALVVTSMVMESGPRYESTDWITGCDFENPNTKGVSESLSCARKNLFLQYNSSKCGEKTNVNDRAVCALEEYYKSNKNKTTQNPNMDKLKRSFEIWNNSQRSS